MATLPAPILRLLTPPLTAALPAGFSSVSERLVAGLPHRVRLTADLAAVLVAPTGTAKQWQIVDARAVVAHSDPQLSPHDAAVSADEMLCPVRLYVLAGDELVAVVPLSAGVTWRIPTTGSTERGVAIELVVVSWDIRAGSLRGAGDYGSSLVFGWLDLRAAPATFSTPVAPEKVLRRLILEPEPEPERVALPVISIVDADA